VVGKWLESDSELALALPAVRFARLHGGVSVSTATESRTSWLRITIGSPILFPTPLQSVYIDGNNATLDSTVSGSAIFDFNGNSADTIQIGRGRVAIGGVPLT